MLRPSCINAIVKWAAIVAVEFDTGIASCIRCSSFDCFVTETTLKQHSYFAIEMMLQRLNEWENPTY